LARHYADFSPERMKKLYDKADLKVLKWLVQIPEGASMIPHTTYFRRLNVE